MLITTLVSRRTPFLVNTPRKPISGVFRHYSTLYNRIDNPYTGDNYCEVPLSSSSEAVKVIEKAHNTFLEWKNTTLQHRIELCQKFVQSFENNKNKIAKDITGQMGKPLSQSYNEIKGMYERTKTIIELSPSALEDEILPEKTGFHRRIVKDPVGVVLCLAPWNYPLLTAINTIIPAVLAGNSIVIKHSPRTPLCAEAFETAFREAGAPPGLVTALHSTHETVHEIIPHPKVGFVAFTGSVSGGRSVYQTVAKRFIDVTLELGGKDPAYVAPDADLDSAVDTLIDGAFYNAGQSCCGIERIYVHHTLYQSFLERAIPLVRSYKLGNPLDTATTLGPLAQSNAPQFLLFQVFDATQRGAKVICGGQPCNDSHGLGRFFEPTLVGDCTHEMSLMRDESFGPVVGVMSVSSDEQAIQLMNDSAYGLTAAVFTRDVERAERFSRALQAGTVFMNRCDYLDPELPWVGVKDSGKGISLSRHGFRGVTKLKGLHFRLPTKK